MIERLAAAGVSASAKAVGVGACRGSLSCIARQLIPKYRRLAQCF